MSKRLRESKSSEQWENHLRSKRAEANLSQGDLAKRVGLTRQALYSIETNQYLPSTEVSLRLARVLNCSVEDLFRFGDGGEVICADFIGSLPATDCPIRAKIAKVGTRMVARPISALGEFLNFTVPADGLVLGPAAGKRQSSCQRQVRLQLLHDQRAIDEQIVLAGCDPAMFLAGEHFRRIHRLGSVVSWTMSSAAAIDALKRGEVHVAGLHLVDRQSGQSNLPYLKRHLRKGHFMVVRFTTWEQGLIVGRGNPKGLRRVADLARRGVRFLTDR